ncbi:MAG: DUF6817 domain-containing protein [Lysobacter sp.]
MQADLETELDNLGAGRVPHSGRMLRDHLIATAKLLEAWGCSADVCAAGMFHSIYGTNAFATSCVQTSRRSRLRRSIGADAERLVYLFSICERPAALLRGLTDLHLVNRFTAEACAVTRGELRDLLAIECANLIEQGAMDGLVETLKKLPPDEREALVGAGVSEGIRTFSVQRGIQVMQSNLATAEPNPQVDTFEEKGYATFKGLMSRDLLDIAFRYYLSYVGTPGYYDVPDDTRALNRYIDALGEAMMPRVQASIEKRIGRRLLPTYSFARIYTTASTLTKHVDRGACEISATMTVGYKNVDALWPVMVESEGEDVPVALDVGDALIYKGMDLPHWREPLPQGIWCQLFFHFVDADGEMTEHRFDGRGRLGPVWPGSVDFRLG